MTHPHRYFHSVCGKGVDYRLRLNVSQVLSDNSLNLIRIESCVVVYELSFGTIFFDLAFLWPS